MTDRETLEKAAEALEIYVNYANSPLLHGLATRLREMANDMLPYEQVDYLMAQSANMEARIAELEALLERWLYTDSVREFKRLNDDTREALK